MLLQRRSQIYRSQSVSAAESVFSSVSFLIRIRELLLVLKASKKIASNPPFPAPPNPSLHLALRSFSLPFFSLSLSLALFPSLLPFSFLLLFLLRRAESVRRYTNRFLLPSGYRLSIFIATRSALFTYISPPLPSTKFRSRSNTPWTGAHDFLNGLQIGRVSPVETSCFSSRPAARAMEREGRARKRKRDIAL